MLPCRLLISLACAILALLPVNRPAAASPCFTMAHWQELAENDWRSRGIDMVIAQSGLCIRKVEMPAARARLMVQQGLVDIDMWRPQLELNEMRNVLPVPTELPGFGVALVVRKDLPVEVKSLTDMLPYTLGAATAYKTAEIVPYIQRFRIDHFTSMQQGFTMLLMHRVDGLLLDLGLYRSMVRNGEVDPRQFRAPLEVMHTPAYMVVHLTRRELVPVLDAAIRKALAEGAFATGDPHGPPS
jgi:hypothetical protein